MTHNTTVVFEVRSARGVLTLGQVYRAIQGTVWVNHSWYRTLYFEGFHEAKSDYRFEVTLPTVSGDPPTARASQTDLGAFAQSGRL